MPLYDFRCPEGTTFEVSFPMSTVPDSTPCPECREPGRRQMGSPRLSIANSTAFKLIESTKRSAFEPEVISGRTGATRRATQYTTNPLHRKLPRP